MKIGGWLVFILISLSCLAWGLRWAIKRGGRKVKNIDPLELIIDSPQSTATADRLVALEGAHNFRDLGGYQTEDGRIVQRGRLFRSDEFSEIGDADLERLKALELRTIIDLRSPSELKDKENRPIEGSTYRQIRIYKREPLLRYLPVALFRRHVLPQALGASYIHLVETRALAFGAALRFLSAEGNLPIVYHCSAGKDRTGIVIALALSVLGVPAETIIADYSLSNLGFEHYYTEFIASGRLARWGIPYEDFQALFVVDPEWMKNLLTYLNNQYGGVETYLTRKAGLTTEELESIRKNLLA